MIGVKPEPKDVTRKPLDISIRECMLLIDILRPSQGWEGFHVGDRLLMECFQIRREFEDGQSLAEQRERLRNIHLLDQSAGACENSQSQMLQISRAQSIDNSR